MGFEILGLVSCTTQLVDYSPEQQCPLVKAEIAYVMTEPLNLKVTLERASVFQSQKSKFLSEVHLMLTKIKTTAVCQQVKQTTEKREENGYQKC